VTIPIQKREEILKSIGASSVDSDASAGAASPGLSERQMEILESMRYSK